MEAALKKVNLYEFLKSQRGLDTELMERGQQLFRRSVSAAGSGQSSAARYAPYTFLMRLLPNIDAESEEQIMKVVRELSKNHCVLLISHRLANVVDSRNIYVLSGGRLAEEGTHNELMGQKGNLCRPLFGAEYTGILWKRKEGGSICVGRESSLWES